MDSLLLTHTAHGWIASPQGPWTADMDADIAAGSNLGMPGATFDRVAALLARVVPQHVVITTEA